MKKGKVARFSEANEMLPPKPRTKPAPKVASGMSTGSGDVAMKHFAYSCPGLSGPGSRMCIEPRSFDVLLSCPYPIIIPIFQRRYCWIETQIKGWWRDATKNCNGSGGMGIHSTGKTSFKLVGGEGEGEGEGGSQQLLCIDGQQRCTTTSLLLAAIRDELLRLLRGAAALTAPERAQAHAVIQRIQSKLFLDPAACTTWAASWAHSATTTPPTGSVGGGEQAQAAWEATHKPGAQLDTLFASAAGAWAGEGVSGARLQPSYVDRRAFYELLTHGMVVHAMWHQLQVGACSTTIHIPVLSEEAQQSAQGLAKRIFDASARSLSSPSSDVAALRSATNHALCSFGLMYCEILSPIDLPQVFLWMQEKALLGMGALLRNDNPGKQYDFLI